MRLIKSVEERNLLKTPVHVINAKIKKKVLELYNYDNILDNTQITDIFLNEDSIKVLLDGVCKDLNLYISLQEFKNCNSILDFTLLVKRKLNTLRMQKTPKQFDFLYVPEIPNYQYKCDNQNSEVDNIPK